jgi:2-polyprenyl-3-methyl-5-hydroxy-6-metoxy-1,4-benzoquinol methylase
MTPQLPYLDKLDPWSSHSLILGWLALLPPGARVLDIGAASGTVGRFSPQRTFILDGIEPEPRWAELAQPFYDRMQTLLLDQTPDETLSGYDVIILADVLEHMPDPLPALQRLARLQETGATFLISVPNVANLYVRLSLLVGRFNYSERGILDKTHLRFFTRKTFCALLEQAGLEVLELRPTPIPLNFVHSFFERRAAGRFIHRLLAAVTRLLPTLLGYQFFAKTVRSSNVPPA